MSSLDELSKLLMKIRRGEMEDPKEIYSKVSNTADKVWEGAMIKKEITEEDFDSLFEGLVVCYRHKGMDKSRQIFVGSRPALMVMFTSMLEMLIKQQVFTTDDVQAIADTVKEVIEKKESV